MGDEDILEVGRVAARLSVEVRTAIGESAIADDLQHGLGHLILVDGELVGIPSVLIIATVSINRTEHAVVHCYAELVLERVASEGSVVHLDIELEVLIEMMGAEEAHYGLCIYVILMLGGLHRFGLDEERALEALLAAIVASDGEHLCQVLFLAFLIGIEERHIAFTSAPEHITGTAKLDGSVDSVLNLHSCTSNHIEVRVGSSTVHIALMAEHVSRAPQQTDAGSSLLLFQIRYDSLHVGFILLNGSCLGYKVGIMEAIILDAHLLHELKAGIYALLSYGKSIGAFSPRERLGAATELVATFCTKGVPPCHGELQPR